MIFENFVFVAVFAMASATKKGDDTLLSVLSKEREEMKDLFRHENHQLRQENKKLQQEDDRLRRRDEQLQERIVKMRDEKLQDENTQLKKEIQKLRHADRRQRDQIDSCAKKLNDSIRQEDVVVMETKKRESQTSNSSQTEAIVEMAFENGSAHATSSWDNSNHSPAKAFIVGNKGEYWHSSSGAKHLGVFPKMIWYDFSFGNGFVPARITFQGAPNADLTFVPSIWEFVGSNDEICSKSGEWTILCRDYSDVQPRNSYAIKRCDVEGRVEKKFRCLGINILSTHTSYSLVWNIRMWRKA